MNLTLRTLLAWLDDTLPPGEVREIGRKVNEAPAAQELVKRIQKVSRRRRLSVPGSSGPDGVDANVVAAYLDNQLNHEQVVEYEKKCLTSDLHLAEVAASHQILSMIGQKAKVPEEAKQRMYRLVKGREAVGQAPKKRRKSRERAQAAAIEPQTPAWVAPSGDAGRGIARGVAPMALIAGLLFLLVISVLMLAPDRGSTPQFQQAAGDDEAAAKKAAAPKVEEKRPEPDPAELERKRIETEKAEAEAKEKEKKEREEKEKQAKLAAPLPPGIAGTVDQSEGVLLRFNKAKDEWDRVGVKATLHEGDRIVAPLYTRHTIQWGALKVALLGTFAGKVLAADRDHTGRIELYQGRILVTGVAPAKPFIVRLEGKEVSVTAPAEIAVGMQRAAGPNPRMGFWSAEGETLIRSGKVEETLKGPGFIDLILGDKPAFSPLNAMPAPQWVTDGRLQPLEQQLADDFSKLIKPDAPVVASLAEGMGDPRKEIREASIATLGEIGELELVITAISTPKDPAARHAAIITLNSLAMRNQDSFMAIRQELNRLQGESRGALFEKLIVGFNADESADPKTQTQLVGLLQDPDVGVREMALGWLQVLTRRDTLGFNPDAPDGPGLEAWKEVLSKGDAIPKASTTRKKAQ